MKPQQVFPEEWTFAATVYYFKLLYFKSFQQNPNLSAFSPANQLNLLLAWCQFDVIKALREGLIF